VAELVVQRAVLLAGLLGLGFAVGPRKRLRLVLSVLAIVCLLGPALAARWWLVRSAWAAHLLLVLLVVLFGQQVWRRPNYAFAAAVVAATAFTHALFFGAGRYGLVCVLLLVPLLAEAFRRPLGSATAAEPSV
jgi:hypothetical protein